jgi:hypothetical protein
VRSPNPESRIPNKQLSPPDSTFCRIPFHFV